MSRDINRKKKLLPPAAATKAPPTAQSAVFGICLELLSGKAGLRESAARSLLLSSKVTQDLILKLLIPEVSVESMTYGMCLSVLE